MSLNPPQREWCETAAQYSSHGSETLRAVQTSPVWLADHSIVELLPIIIKRCQSWSHIVLPVTLITPPLLGSKQLHLLRCSLAQRTHQQKQKKTWNCSLLIHRKVVGNYSHNQSLYFSCSTGTNMTCLIDCRVCMFVLYYIHLSSQLSLL